MTQKLFKAAILISLGIQTLNAQSNSVSATPPNHGTPVVGKWQLSDSAVESKAKAYILQQLPLGTPINEAITALIKDFGANAVRRDPNNGIILPDRKLFRKTPQVPIGTQSIKVVVAERQEGLAAERLYAFLGFNEKGALLAIEMVREVDGP